MFNDQRFNDTLTNDIISFEQLGPVQCSEKACQELHCLPYWRRMVRQPCFGNNGCDGLTGHFILLLNI